MNWSERHLNWSVVLAALVLNIAVYSISQFTDLEGTLFLIFAFILPFLLMIPVVAWMLNRKNRKPWWLLMWCFVPIFGPIFVLTLSNKSDY